VFLNLSRDRSCMNDNVEQKVQNAFFRVAFRVLVTYCYIMRFEALSLAQNNMDDSYKQLET